jgi:hypothetical protein
MLQTLLSALSGASFVGIIIFILQWIRYKNKDKSDTGKINAETAKIKAEAAQIEAHAQVTVADAALKLAQRLGEECDMTKIQLNKAQIEIAGLRQELTLVTKRLEEVQLELTKQIEKNNAMVAEINKLKRVK